MGTGKSRSRTGWGSAELRCAARTHPRTHARTSGAIPPPLLQPKSESEAIREFFTSLALNHTVLVEVDEKDPSIRKYNGASPDEEALVIAAKNVGFKFLEKDKSALGETMKVEVNGYGEVSSRLLLRPLLPQRAVSSTLAMSSAPEIIISAANMIPRGATVISTLASTGARRSGCSCVWLRALCSYQSD
jgi:magnesium-transporting ATPase (P-type)